MVLKIDDSQYSRGFCEKSQTSNLSSCPMPAADYANDYAQGAVSATVDG
ncbi:MAG: hypothetical protein ACFB0D_23345 [Phormidesmis sp.]